MREATRMAMHTLEELFEHELHDIYAAERSLVDALEQMADETLDKDIRQAYVLHRKETLGQIRRLDKVFKMLGQKANSEQCHGMEGLLKEKKAFVREKPSAGLLEFYNIGASQKVERYEITAYETLIDMADKIGLPNAVELLEQNLQEEEGALNRLKMFASEFDVTEASPVGAQHEEEGRAGARQTR